MQKKLILGVVLTLAFTFTSPVVAAEEKPFQLPSIEIVEWVFGLLDLVTSSIFASEIGPGLEPNGDENPAAVESGSGHEPNGEPPEEIGPGYEPWG